MKARTIRLHIFCSVKGGVGKTSLAVITAKLLAALGRVPALVDCDLSGTSLADGLRLCAPYTQLDEDGAVDLQAAPSEKFYTVEESRVRRAERRTAIQTDEKWKSYPHPPPYLNDALNHAYAAKEEGWPIDGRTARMDTIAWRHEKPDGVYYFPSSSVRDDVALSMVWLLEEPFEFARALTISLDGLAKQMQTITDIVLDLPPGIWGFPHEVLLVAHYLLTRQEFPPDFPPWHEETIQWVPNPFLITSEDPNDFMPGLEYVALHKEKLPNLQPVVNRTTTGIESIREEARRRLGTLLAHTGLDQNLRYVGHDPLLAKIFRDGDVDIQKLPKHTLAKTLRLGDEQ